MVKSRPMSLSQAMMPRFPRILLRNVEESKIIVEAAQAKIMAAIVMKELKS